MCRPPVILPPEHPTPGLPDFRGLSGSFADIFKCMTLGSRWNGRNDRQLHNYGNGRVRTFFRDDDYEGRNSAHRINGSRFRLSATSD